MKTVNIQVLGGSSPWTRPSAPECGDTLKASASFGLDQGNLAPGSLSTGSPAGRALLLLKRREGLNVQSGLRKARQMVKPCPDERSRP